jgi:hypothetical protein
MSMGFGANLDVEVDVDVDVDASASLEVDASADVEVDVEVTGDVDMAAAISADAEVNAAYEGEVSADVDVVADKDVTAGVDVNVEVDVQAPEVGIDTSGEGTSVKIEMEAPIKITFDENWDGTYPEMVLERAKWRPGSGTIAEHLEMEGKPEESYHHNGKGVENEYLMRYEHVYNTTDAPWKVDENPYLIPKMPGHGEPVCCRFYCDSYPTCHGQPCDNDFHVRMDWRTLSDSAATARVEEILQHRETMKEERAEVASERMARLHRYDKECRDMKVEMANQSHLPMGPAEENFEKWKAEILALGEEEEVECNGMPMHFHTKGFHNFPSLPGKKFLGDGFIMITKQKPGCRTWDMKDPEPSHRIHFYNHRETSHLKAREDWGYSYTGADNADEEGSGSVSAVNVSQHGKTRVNVQHVNDVQYTSINVEGNLYHCHYDLDDSAKVGLHQFGGAAASPCCCCDCCACCDCCPCLPCLIDCCCCCKQVMKSGSWEIDVTDAPRTHHIVTEEYVDDIEEGTVTYPWDTKEKMETKHKGYLVKQLKGTEMWAYQQTKLHTINIMMRDPGTDKISNVSVLVEINEDEDLARGQLQKLQTFVSYMGRLTVPPAAFRDWKSISMPSSHFDFGAKEGGAFGGMFGGPKIIGKDGTRTCCDKICACVCCPLYQMGLCTAVVDWACFGLCSCTCNV